MASEIKWTKTAIKSFQQIVIFIQTEWGEQSAGTFTKKVFHVLELLREFTRLGSLEHPFAQIRGFVYLIG